MRSKLNRFLLRFLRLGAAAAGAAVLMAGCSSSPSASPGSTVSTSVLPAGAEVPFHESKNARADVTLSSCMDVNGKWVAMGTARNPTSSPKGYQIVVDFATKPGGTVLSTTEVRVSHVAAGATQHWSAAGAPGGVNVACLLRIALYT